MCSNILHNMFQTIYLVYKNQSFLQYITRIYAPYKFIIVLSVCHVIIKVCILTISCHGVHITGYHTKIFQLITSDKFMNSSIQTLPRGWCILLHCIEYSFIESCLSRNDPKLLITIEVPMSF